MSNYNLLFEIPKYQLKNHPQAQALSHKVEGKWISFSSQDLVDRINNISKAFIKFGLKPDDKVAIISPNRPEWNFVDAGMLQVGIVNVPIYPTISKEDYKFIFNDSEIKIAFVADADLYQKISDIKNDVPSLQAIYSFDYIEECRHLSEFERLAEGISQEEVDDIAKKIKEENLATIIYTSGTTGTPKGVMLSHHNIVSNIKAVLPLLPVANNHKTLSFLPLCHIFERVVLYVYMAVGCSVYYAESIEALSDNLKEVQPHFFSCVPRLLEKVYDKIMAKGYELTGIKKKLFFWAVDMGLEYTGGPRNGLKWKIADKLIFSKWREALGGNVVGIVTGAAALQERLGRVFSAAGIAIREGYGQTETSPVISVNQFEEGNYMFGTVGPIIPGVEVEFGEFNEILVKGPNVMMGYYKRQDLTDEAFTNGWLKTGDVGELVNGKFLKITDRVKELFKTSGGKYVAPQVVENKMKESAYIEQICVVGENRKFVGAVIVPSFLALSEYCTRHGIIVSNNNQMVDKPEVVTLMKDEIERLNQSLGKIEQIKRFKLIHEEWSIESGELTPTLKVKRKVVMERYANLIEEIYDVD